MLFATIFISSCYVAPKSIFHIEAANENGVWLMGKQYFKSTTDAFEVVLAFNKMKDYRLEFQVEITNNGEEPLLVAPENFYITYQKKGKYDSVYAINPEEEILEANKNLSREYASYYSAKQNQSIRTFFSLVVAVAEIGKTKTEEEILEDENDDLKREIEELETELEHEKNVKYIDNYLTEWEYKALRKTTLPKGYAIRGDLYFPIIRAAGKLDIVFVIDNKEIKFAYNQIEEKVTYR